MEYIASAMPIGQIAGDQTFTQKMPGAARADAGRAEGADHHHCTHALEMAALLLDIKPGDEVIVPSFTFVSTVNAFVLRGAKPVFCRRSPRHAEPRRDEARSADHAAHASDRAGALRRRRLRDGRDLRNRQAARRARRRRQRPRPVRQLPAGKYLGTFGALATQSFHETKNVTCGEGGALLINDPQFIERAEIIREKGTNRSRFFRGQVDKYTWVDVGSSYLHVATCWPRSCSRSSKAASEIQASAAGDLGSTIDASLPTGPTSASVCAARRAGALRAGVSHVLPAAAFACRADGADRHLKSHGILAVFHYLPLHLSDMGRNSADARAIAR